MSAISNDYRVVLDNQKKADDARRNVAALRQLATNRFLGANLLNALQQTTVDDIELLRLKVAQDYIPTEEVKPRKDNDRTIPGRPATVTEKIMVTLEAGTLRPARAIRWPYTRTPFPTTPIFARTWAGPME